MSLLSVSKRMRDQLRDASFATRLAVADNYLTTGTADTVVSGAVSHYQVQAEDSQLFPRILISEGSSEVVRRFVSGTAFRRVLRHRFGIGAVTVPQQTVERARELAAVYGDTIMHTLEAIGADSSASATSGTPFLVHVDGYQYDAVPGQGVPGASDADLLGMAIVDVIADEEVEDLV